MIPVIIFHLGNQDYLKKCIQQAIYFKNPVFLIGDATNQYTNEMSKNLLFKHFHIDTLIHDTLTQQFLQTYKHVSPNNELFEKNLYSTVVFYSQTNGTRKY